MTDTHTDYYFTLPQSWLFVFLIVNLALVLYLVTVVNVGRARARCKVAPPAVTGHPEFERYFRVQQNTLEQLVLFLPSLLLFAVFWEAPRLAAALGGLWLTGRIFYTLGYYKDTAKRLPGFVMAMLSTVVLALGSLVAILKALI